jgi:hypothetical protein
MASFEKCGPLKIIIEYLKISVAYDEKASLVAREASSARPCSGQLVASNSTLHWSPDAFTALVA